MTFKLFKTQRVQTSKKLLWSLDLFCICSYPEEVEEPVEEDLLTDFSLVSISYFGEKKGISLIWIHSPSDDLDIWGRSLFGVYTNYGKLVIELLFMRILLF